MQRMDNTNHWINLYPVDSTVGFVNAFPLYSDSSIQYHNLPLKQPKPELLLLKTEPERSWVWLTLLMIAVVHVAFKECFFLEKVWEDKKKKNGGV